MIYLLDREGKVLTEQPERPGDERRVIGLKTQILVRAEKEEDIVGWLVKERVILDAKERKRRGRLGNA